MFDTSSSNLYVILFQLIKKFKPMNFFLLNLNGNRKIGVARALTCTVNSTEIADLYLVATLVSVFNINVHNIQIPFLYNWHSEI